MILVGDLFLGKKKIHFFIKKNWEFYGLNFTTFSFFGDNSWIFLGHKIGKEIKPPSWGNFLKIIILKLLEVLRKIRVHYVVHHH